MKVFSIAIKELKYFFKTPVAYIVLTVTMGILNTLFYLIIEENKEATLRDLFQTIEFIFIFIIPLITMRSFAEEKASGTLEFLLTTPTPAATLVLGKYLGSLVILCSLIAVVPVYYCLIGNFAHIDALATWVGFGGIFLEGAFFMALGLLTSSFSRSPVSAAILSYAIFFFLYFAMSFSSYVPNQEAQNFLKAISTFSHLENFAVGVVRFSDIAYYLSGIFACLYLLPYHIDSRLLNRI